MNTVSKKASCNDLRPRIKSISHRFWWACSTCKGDAQILSEKWLSIIFYVQNIDHWTAFTKFYIHVLSCSVINWKTKKKKNWLSPTSEFKALQDIVFSNSILKDLTYLTKFSHTGTLEVYHFLYNRWIRKSIHFSFHGMIVRTQLAILHFNSGSNLNTAATRKVKNDAIPVSVKWQLLGRPNPLKKKSQAKCFKN